MMTHNLCSLSLLSLVLLYLFSFDWVLSKDLPSLLDSSFGLVKLTVAALYCIFHFIHCIPQHHYLFLYVFCFSSEKLHFVCVCVFFFNLFFELPVFL